jgi:hypothetical protein
MYVCICVYMYVYMRDYGPLCLALMDPRFQAYVHMCSCICTHIYMVDVCMCT